MENHVTTNVRPRRSRRASMSCMPSADDGDAAKALAAMGKSKEELYEQYKVEKAARLKAHEDAEEQFRQKTTVQLEETSGLAEQEDAFSTKVELGAFELPKVSRRQRRASMGVTLQILDPIEDVKLELEEISKVTMPISPVTSTPTFSGGLFTGGPLPGTWDGSAGADPSLMFSAETLAGWKTVTFADGPLGMQLEPTVGDKACKVTGFLDTLGCPSQARASGQIQFDDVIVKVNGKLPKSYEETLEMIAVGGERLITFRPGFSYELVDLSASMDSPGKAKKKKVGRMGRRASMGSVPASLPKSPTDVFDGMDNASSKKDEDCGYDDMGYGDAPTSQTVDSPKPKKKSSRGRRASMSSMPAHLSKEDIRKAKKEAVEKFRNSDASEEDMGYGEEAPSSKEKKKQNHSKRSRRASCAPSMPSMPGLVCATDIPKEAPPKEEPKKKAVSKRGRRASMSSMPPAMMPGLVGAIEAKPKEEKVPSKKKTCFDTLGCDTPVSQSGSTGDLGYEKAEPEPKVEKKKVSKKSRRASIAAMPSSDDVGTSKNKMAVIEAMEKAEAAKKEKKKKKKDTDDASPESPKADKPKKKKDAEESSEVKKPKPKSKTEDKEKKKKKESKEKK